MSKKLQVNLSTEAWEILEGHFNQLKGDHQNISINYSELISEIIIGSKIDIKHLQNKYTNLRKSLRELSKMKEIDLDLTIKSLIELKNKTLKKNSKQSINSENSFNE